LSELFSKQMLIGGRLVESVTGQTLDVINPANEQLVGRVPSGAADDVDRAVQAAAGAQPDWMATDITERAALLRSLAHVLEERQAELTRVEVIDTGNTITKMRGDVAKAVAQIEYFAGIGLELKGETVPSTARHLHLTIREPFGVVGRIVPFNHPLMFAAARMAAPLMAGNTIVIKPAEQSPISSCILGEICADVLPPGVVNIVTGHGETAGDALVRHPAVKRIGFTGSVATGLAIQRAAAETAVKTITLELGGKNPCIVFPDTGVDVAVDAAISGMNFAWQGQSCGSTSRLFVHESQYAAVTAELKKRVEALRVGDPLDESSDMGPINSAAHYEKVLSAVAAGQEDGATLLTGGDRPAGEYFHRGYWIRPTVFVDVKPGMRIFHEEIFGPVLSVVKWSDEEELIGMVNATEYGLTAALWTKDVARALRLSRRIRAGYIWINGVSSHYLGLPFGGVDNSGIGREEGIEELFSYTQAKALTIHT